MKKFLALIVVALAAVMTFGFAQEDVQGETIIDVLRQNEDLLVFREALLATDLASNLEGEENYTVFAPTNEAFSDVAIEAWDTNVLGSYVVEGMYTIEILNEMLAEQGGAAALDTVTGAELSLVRDDDGAIVIGGVARLGEDAIAANGVVITIDNIIPVSAGGEEGEFGEQTEVGFTDFDSDQSGDISEEEFNLGVDQFSGGESETGFSELDTDQSGALTEEEFAAYQ